MAKKRGRTKLYNSDMPYGNGCPLYRDCFTCPAPDCVWRKYISKARQEKIIVKWKPYFDSKLKEATNGAI